MKSNDWCAVCARWRRCAYWMFDRSLSNGPDHLAWSRLETLLQYLELLKGTPEGAVAGLGARAVKLHLCTPF
jgi:hypothetical protein